MTNGGADTFVAGGCAGNGLGIGVDVVSAGSSEEVGSGAEVVSGSARSVGVSSPSPGSAQAAGSIAGVEPVTAGRG
ncbi:hypothetical protein ABZV65_10880 [Streptomyces bauhiniae]|uniref:hypothetical protein n=1 Tax=Streptomyces bauhiniae TaxID=2340725 RepID=UPI0033BA00FF